jgi:hypothetical protein
MLMSEASRWVSPNTRSGTGCDPRKEKLMIVDRRRFIYGSAAVAAAAVVGAPLATKVSAMPVAPVTGIKVVEPLTGA